MRSLSILLFAVLIGSCKSSLPRDVMPPKQMQAVLWDVLQADEMAEYYSVKDSSFKNLSKHADYYQKIFALHRIRKEDFVRSMDYYKEHPVLLKTVLDSLQSFVQHLEKADTLGKAIAPKLPDSILKKPHFPINHH